MKRIVLTFALLCLCIVAYAQWDGTEQDAYNGLGAWGGRGPYNTLHNDINRGLVGHWPLDADATEFGSAVSDDSLVVNLTMAAADSALGTELITDGGAESGLPTLNSNNFTAARGSVAQSADQAHGGSNSVKYTGDNSAGTKYSHFAAADFDAVTTSGGLYEITAWEWIPDANTVIDAIHIGYSDVYSTDVTATDTWTLRTFPFNATTTDILIYGRDATATATVETFYTDDISLKGVYQNNQVSGGQDAQYFGIEGALEAGATDRFGRANQATDLESTSSDYFLVDSNSALDLLDTATITIWFKIESIPNYMTFCMFYKDATDRISFGVSNAGKLRVYDDIDNINNEILGTTTLSTDTWYRADYTVASDGTISLYLNGTLENSEDHDKTFADLNDGYDLYIGAEYSSAYHFDGVLDDFDIWRNDVHTATEIFNDYYATRPQATDEAGSNTIYLLGATLATGPRGAANGALDFDGTDDRGEVGDTSLNIKGVSFFINLDDATSRDIMDLDGETHTITVDGSSDITATGWTSPTIYVDGEEKTAVSANTWYHIAVTTDTAIDANDVLIGYAGSAYLDGTIADIRYYIEKPEQKTIRKLAKFTP